jgi:hypothetical protein
MGIGNLALWTVITLRLYLRLQLATHCEDYDTGINLDYSFIYDYDSDWWRPWWLIQFYCKSSPPHWTTMTRVGRSWLFMAMTIVNARTENATIRTKRSQSCPDQGLVEYWSWLVMTINVRTNISIRRKLLKENLW